MAFKLKVILGSKRKIYKKKGSSKEYLKYKGKMMNVVKYKKMKTKKLPKKTKTLKKGGQFYSDVGTKYRSLPPREQANLLRKSILSGEVYRYFKDIPRTSAYTHQINDDDIRKIKDYFNDIKNYGSYYVTIHPSDIQNLRPQNLTPQDTTLQRQSRRFDYDPGAFKSSPARYPARSPAVNLQKEIYQAKFYEGEPYPNREQCRSGDDKTNVRCRITTENGYTMRLDGKCNGQQNKCSARAVYADAYRPGAISAKSEQTMVDEVVNAIGGRKKKLKKLKKSSKKVKKIK